MKTRNLVTLSTLILTLVCVMGQGKASAQYPVTAYTVDTPAVAYTSVRSEVVGYQVERRGLLGRRAALRPVVAPVARTVVTPATRTVVAPPAPRVAAPVYATLPAVQTPTAIAPVTPMPAVTPVTYLTPVVPRY